MAGLDFGRRVRAPAARGSSDSDHRQAETNGEKDSSPQTSTSFRVREKLENGRLARPAWGKAEEQSSPAYVLESYC